MNKSEDLDSLLLFHLDFLYLNSVLLEIGQIGFFVLWECVLVCGLWHNVVEKLYEVFELEHELPGSNLLVFGPIVPELLNSVQLVGHLVGVCEILVERLVLPQERNQGCEVPAAHISWLCLWVLQSSPALLVFFHDIGSQDICKLVDEKPLRKVTVLHLDLVQNLLGPVCAVD